MRKRKPSVCPRCKSPTYAVPRIRPIELGRGEGVEQVVDPHRQAVRRIALAEGVQALWVFGSVRRREATSRSDVDLLVRWDHPVSILTKARLLRRLEEELGRPVDLVDWDAMHWALAPQVHAEAVPI